MLVLRMNGKQSRHIGIVKRGSAPKCFGTRSPLPLSTLSNLLFPQK